MVSLYMCLSVPECDVGLRDNDNLTAFDISSRSGNQIIPTLFYKNLFETEEQDPQAALLLVFTITSQPAKDKTAFPGEVIFEPV